MGKQSLEGYFLGVDVGTQGTKTVLCSGQTGDVLGSAREEYPLIEKADGTREQDPALWIEAVKNTIKSVLADTGVDKTLVFLPPHVHLMLSARPSAANCKKPIQEN